MKTQHRYKIDDMITDGYQVYDIKDGGMGTVYLCRSTKIKSLYWGCAMKAIKDEYLANPQIREQFYHEAYLWMKLGYHPNIVACTSVQRLNHQLFLRLRLIPGRPGIGADLATLAKYQHFDAVDATTTVLKICYGLQYAYEKVGLIHRDLKPQNILVDELLGVHVSDFGLAATLRSNATSTMQTEQTAISGTPGYMSPEQCRKEKLDLRSDIYAVGCIFYELLSGQKVVSGRHLSDFIHATLYQSPKPLKSIISDVPTSVNSIVNRCLAKAADERYQTYGELIDDLQKAIVALGGDIPRTYPTPEDYSTLDLLPSAQFLKARGLRELGYVEEALDTCQNAFSDDEEEMMPIRYEQAICYAILGRKEEAESEFRNLLAVRSNSIELLTDFSSFLTQAGRHVEALKYIQDAVELMPSDSRVHVQMAFVLSQLGRKGEAVAFLEKALQFDKKNAYVWLNLGGHYNGSGNYREALKCFEYSVEAAPAFAYAWYRKAQTHLLLKEFEEALFACSEAILRNNDDQYSTRLGFYDETRGAILHPAKAYLLRSHVFVQLERYEEAKSDLLKAVELDPTLAQTVFDYEFSGNNEKIEQLASDDVQSSTRLLYGKVAWCCFQLEQLDEAILWLTRALEIEHTNVGIYLFRAEIYMKQKCYEEALRDYNQAVQITPHSAAVYHDRASLLDDLNRLEEALVDYNRAVELAPNSASIISDRSVTYRKLGAYELSLADCNRAIELDPQFVLAYQNRGFAHMSLNRMEEAAADYSKMIELEPSNAIGFSRRGACYFYLQLFTAACDDLYKAIELAPNEFSSWFYMGATLIEVGHEHEAINSLSRAYEIAPERLSQHTDTGIASINEGKLQEGIWWLGKPARVGYLPARLAWIKLMENLGILSKEENEYTQRATEALIQANSFAETLQVVSAFPHLVNQEYISQLETLMTNPYYTYEQQLLIDQRLTWLYQIADTQG